MFKKILVLLMMGTLPMFAKSHGGSLDIYTLITYILVGSVLIIVSGLIYFSRKIDSSIMEFYKKSSVWIVAMVAIIFLIFMIEPLFVFIPLPFLALIMIISLLIDIVPTLYKKLFK